MSAPAAAPARRRVAGALVALRREPVLACALLLIATMLVQRPLLEVRGSGASLLIRSWDLAWLLLAVVALPMLVARRAEVRAAVWPPRGSALALYALFAALAVVSLSWELATFGADGFVAAAVRAGRMAMVAVLAVALLLVWSARVARILAVAIVAASVVAALLAVGAWLLDSAPGTGAGVTRAGGPFGNAYADGTRDRWWAAPAASTNLGFWLGVSIALLAGGLAAARGRRRLLLGAALVPALAGLIATHSRESFVATAFGLAVLAVALSRQGVLPRLRLLVPAAVIAVAVALVAIPSLRERVLDSFRPGTFAYGTGPAARLDAWEDGLRIGTRRAPVGWGVGGVEEHPERFGRGTVENVFLQAYVQTGVAGALLLLAAVLTGLLGSLRALRGDRAGPLLGVAVFGVLLAHGMFGNTIGDPTVQVLLACGLAAAAAGRGREAAA